MKDYLNELPPELILLVSPSLSTASLNALASTSRRTHEILQPELESRLTPELRETLLWAPCACKPHIVKKLLSPPHLIRRLRLNVALLFAAKAKHIEIVKLLLDAGANPTGCFDEEDNGSFHIAVLNQDFAMMKLLLDHGAPVDEDFGWDGSQNALHYASSLGYLEMIKFLLDHGADLEGSGHYGAPLGFAVHGRNIEAVKFLLEKGANATITVPLFVFIGDWRPPLPHQASLLYIALGLRHPNSDPPEQSWARSCRRSRGEEEPTPVRWEGLPLGKERKEMMALLMANGAIKDGAMATITQYLDSLAEAALYSEEEYLQVIAEMFKEAEEAIPRVERN
ncbi:ANK-REP-region domain-containing protein [Favolaschia claudopus]|uniref:ANK-REP-region domain-containing protein n=1 Tax=Favolaschia claudopus TaxID=2862362 RepID=A0AAW0BEI8_9AGAR